MKYEVWGRKEKLVDVVADGFEKTIGGDLVFYRETKGTTLPERTHTSAFFGLVQREKSRDGSKWRLFWL